MSFSGLKTALLRTRDALVAEKGGLTEQDRADLCAGFQAAVADVLAEKSRRALALYLAENPATPGLCGRRRRRRQPTLRAALETVAARRRRRALPRRRCRCAPTTPR